MTNIEAEYFINSVLNLRKKGIKDTHEIITHLQKEFDWTENDLGVALDLIGTAAFRASIISSGLTYPKGNLNIEDHPILKNAFRMFWIEHHGEEHYIKYYKNKLVPWWLFWKKIKI